ncbi:MAG TPA: mevalonate kinase [Polyangia bacterium]|nr:mevalonate kinase [Polyangia bacterium]
MTWSLASATGTARGKAILAGEHAVVHGVSALGLALPLLVTAHARPRPGPVAIAARGAGFFAAVGDGSSGGLALEALLDALGLPLEGAFAEVSSELPFGSGLGSSAALAAAVARACSTLAGREPGFDALFAGVQASEQIFHGNPSGLDALLALRGGLVRFTREAGAEALSAAPPPLVIAHSGTPGDTGVAVKRFAARLAGGDEGRRRLAAIAGLVEDAARCLIAGDLEGLGAAMDGNHGHLAWFQVSTPALDELCRIARGAGALGAKLTGGGLGGCAVALVRPGAAERVARAVSAAGFQVVLP